ncbi:MAG: MarR family transcriptional regulator, partial [Nitrosopumilus sp.]|nr:MarR family transcriptional regulator [Nitrosopumilus sp.]MBT4299497.1 MarR family transcriptional regulator [Nitrosopumilus sp.]MBT5278281.1 MarR family transcriptional regulator [Nitrosopumilus sp.]MBT6194206.1 MarR family transcriptional regulator [Nitrosopumilus sp.]
MAGGKNSTTNKQGGSKDSKKSKKDKGDSGPRKAEITVMVNEKQAMKIIQNSKVVTVQDLAR